MKISELMEELGVLQGEHGDIDVCVFAAKEGEELGVTAVGSLVPIFAHPAHAQIVGVVLRP